jgi:hypothetical protein
MMIRQVTAVVLLLAVTTSPTMASEATFEVPVSLSNLSPDVTQVRVRCSVAGGERDASHGVSGGSVNTTLRILVGLPDPGGNTYSYSCQLRGYSTSLQRWEIFSATHSLPQFRVSPTPPSSLEGSFVW